MMTKRINPIITTIATSISVGIPDGINDANVPLRMMAAEITTVPIAEAAITIRSVGRYLLLSVFRYRIIRKIL